MKLTLAKKILTMVAALVSMALVLQGYISGSVVVEAIRRNTQSQLMGELQAKTAYLESVVRATGEDLKVMRTQSKTGETLS